MEFGQRLKKARLDKGLTQEHVATDFMVTRQTISSWENQKSYPDILSLIAISDYFDISLDILLKEDANMQTYLKKKEVEKRLRPLTALLVTVDIIFIILMTSDSFNLIKLSHDLSLAIFLFGMINVAALFILNNLKEILGINHHSKRGREIMAHLTSRKALAALILTLVIGIILTMANLPSFGGFLMGLAVVLLVNWLILHSMNKTRHR
ncbi:helix-turn-helix domain-containing protein [Furfurilactobacillus sp. WILCCON 0119]